MGEWEEGRVERCGRQGSEEQEVTGVGDAVTGVVEARDVWRARGLGSMKGLGFRV